MVQRLAAVCRFGTTHRSMSSAIGKALADERASAGPVGAPVGPIAEPATEIDLIDRIDVVATLVPEEDAWQFGATETCTTETHRTESRS